MLERHHHRSSCVGHCSAPGVSSSLLSRPVAPRAPHAAVVLRAGGNGAENGRLTSEKQREIAKILLQTQKNMLELNNSRVKVQEELAMAHRRIADLGACVSADQGPWEDSHEPAAQAVCWLF